MGGSMLADFLRLVQDPCVMLSAGVSWHPHHGGTVKALLPGDIHSKFV